MSAAVLDIVSWLCILAGGVFVLVGGIGVLRLPDLFTRLHAAGVTDTGGAGLIFLGLILQSGLSLVTVKVVLIFAFSILTTPTATHALAKAALHGGVRPDAHEEPGH